MQGLFKDEGVMPLLDDLFNKAADLQTESNDDVRCAQGRCQDEG